VKQSPAQKGPESGGVHIAMANVITAKMARRTDDQNPATLSVVLFLEAVFMVILVFGVRYLRLIPIAVGADYIIRISFSAASAK
jgi:hypothetical protein